MNSFVGTHPPPSAATRKTRRRRRPGGRGGAPSTPLHYWTLYNNNTESKKHFHFSSDAGAEDEAKFSGGGHAVELSARKLASRLWRLRSLRFGIGGFSARRKSSDRSRFKPADMSRVDLMPSRDQSSKGHCSGTKHQLPRSQSTIVGPKQGSIHKGAMQRDCRCSKASPIEADCFASHMKLLEDQVKTVSFVSALQAELVQARLYIHDLEYEVQSSRHRIKYLVRKLGAEGTSQQRKEHEKIYALVDDLKCQLSRERKKQQKMEVIKSQLIKELAEAKLSSMQSVQKYEAEKRTRKLLEEVCCELARKIGEDEAEVEAMRIETMRIRDEIEEERSMLHVAEVWREERVQMKLIDAKLALESKYSQLNKLKTVLETFLMSRSTSLERDLRKAELIRQAVKAVSIQDMEEFSYEPLRSGDIFSIFEELRHVTMFERDIGSNYTLTGDISDYNSGMEEDNKGHEKVHHVENRGSVEEGDRSIITVGVRRSAPRFEIEQDETATRASPNTETNGAYNIITYEGKGQLSTGTVSGPSTYLPTGKSINDSLKNQKPMVQYDSADLVNPHVTRGMKVCTLKAKPESRTENKKSQLHTYSTSP